MGGICNRTTARSISRSSCARGSLPETRSPARECREDLGASQTRRAEEGACPQEGRNEEALRCQAVGIGLQGESLVVVIGIRSWSASSDARPTSDLSSSGGSHLAYFERVTWSNGYVELFGRHRADRTLDDSGFHRTGAGREPSGLCRFGAEAAFCEVNRRRVQT